MKRTDGSQETHDHRLAAKALPFEVPPFRPPSEAYSLLLRATRGCPWNRCTFCGMYKKVRFEVRPAVEVLRDIRSAYEFYGVHVRTAFIGDADALITPADDLLGLLDTLYSTFPRLERVTCYARARTLLRRRPAELRRLRESGLTRVHVGLESGDDEILNMVRKGITSEEMVAAGLMAKEVGFSLCYYVILGLGGSLLWRRHAEATAKVISRVDPHFIRLRTLWAEPAAPLFATLARGGFAVASAAELLSEERMLIACLEGVTSWLESDHPSNLLRLRGRFPADKERLLARLDSALSGHQG